MFSFSIKRQRLLEEEKHERQLPIAEETAEERKKALRQRQIASNKNIFKDVPAVSVLGLEKSFGATKVLRGISMQANDHDVISLIGRSGSGKSTLLRCLNLLEVPDAGEIRIKDELIEIDRTHHHSRPGNFKQINRIRSRVGMVFQSFNLWPHKTVLENVIEAPIHVLGQPKDKAIETAKRLLLKVGLYNRIHSYPARLSGGEKQRTAIARTLAMDPQVILFDEPTSALDPGNVAEVLQVIKDLADEGRTMILVTHEMQFARDISTNIMFLAKGKILEQGKPENIFTNPSTSECRKFLGL